MPVHFPDSFEWLSARVVMEEAVTEFIPFVGPSKFSEWNEGKSDRWSFVYRVTAEDMHGVFAFLVGRGRRGEVYAFDPRRTVPAGGVVEDMKVDGGGQTGRSLDVKGGPANQTPLVAGDYFQIDDQFFIATADLDLDGSGEGELHFWPAIRDPFDDEEEIITEDPVFIGRITSRVEMPQEGQTPPEITFSVEEVA